MSAKVSSRHLLPVAKCSAVVSTSQLHRPVTGEERMKTVQCVPGGHQVDLEHAYWCNKCSFYLCYKHLRTSVLTTSKTYDRGHEVSKAK
jgi:hypothetical protein